MKTQASTNYSQEIEYILCGELIKWVKPNFIDVGAERGSFSRCMIDSGFDEGYAFEPLPRHFADLRKTLGREKIHVFDYALDAIERDADFHVACDNNGLEADYYHSLNRLDNDKNVNHSKTITVKCKTIKQLIDQKLIPDHIGLLKLDTEGNDLNVIKGMGEFRPEVIMCEFFMPGIYNGWADASPLVITPHMASLGYTNHLAIKRNNLYQNLELNPIAYVDNTWGNLIFFTDEIFNKSKNWITQHLIQSEIARVELIKNMQKELEAKEAVIQNFLKKKSHLKK